MLHLWYSPIYTEGLSKEVRFPRMRYRMVRSGLEPDRRNSEIFFHEPEALAPAEFLLAHCPDYVDRFLTNQLSEKEIRRIGLKPWNELIIERTRVLTGGTVAATRHVLETNSQIAGNIGGGTHHGYWDFGSGYCIFNDLAIAAEIARRDYQIKNITILDLDVHQGDGTAAIFAKNNAVRTVSMHCQANFPFRKMESDLDLALDKETGDDDYLAQLSILLENELSRDRHPELILFQAGVDVLKTDRLGHLSLSPEAVSRRNQMVFEFAKTLNAPMVLTMGGGYGEPIETSIDAHIDLFQAGCRNY